MKIENRYPKRVANIFENDFLNLYFLDVDMSLTMHDQNLKIYIYVLKTLLLRELCLGFLIWSWVVFFFFFF